MLPNALSSSIILVGHAAHSTFLFPYVGDSLNHSYYSTLWASRPSLLLTIVSTEERMTLGVSQHESMLYCSFMSATIGLLIHFTSNS